MFVVLHIGTPPVHAAELSRADLVTLAEAIAEQHGITDVPLFVKTVSCESGFYYAAKSPTNDTGIAQIHLASHPDITEAEALDPYWSLNWMAEAWQNGHARWWSCYRMLTKPASSM